MSSACCEIGNKGREQRSACAHLHSDELGGTLVGGGTLIGVGHVLLGAEVVLAQVLVVILASNAPHGDEVVNSIVIVACRGTAA